MQIFLAKIDLRFQLPHLRKLANVYEYCIYTFCAKGVSVQTGVFGANMEVNLLNDGPVTISVEI
ncbi:MAG TPA: hypothetical protein DEA75_15220 [Rhodobacteraceae bacterium]|nr:hypothetical protein [Paracoccaceae bacterium]